MELDRCIEGRAGTNSQREIDRKRCGQGLRGEREDDIERQTDFKKRDDNATDTGLHFLVLYIMCNVTVAF